MQQSFLLFDFLMSVFLMQLNKDKIIWVVFYKIRHFVCILWLKAGYMKTHSLQKEILVMTGTTFEQNNLRKINNKNDHVTFKKQKQRVLDQAYWNVLLPEILPEITGEKNGNSIYVSFIRKGHSFIQLEIGEEPLIIEREYSLDPYLLLSAQIYN